MSSHLGSGLEWISDGVDVGGPPANAERVLLDDGSNVVIRPLAVGDESEIASWFSCQFAGLGAETLYARLFVLLERLDRSKETRSAHAGSVDEEAIAAFAQDGVTVGLARFTRTGEPTSAEVTVAVAGDRRELQSLLLERVATRALSLGVEQLTSVCLANDDTLISLLSRLGPTTVGPSRPGLVEARIDLAHR